MSEWSLQPNTSYRLSAMVYGFMVAGVVVPLLRKSSGDVGLRALVHTARSVLLLGSLYFGGMLINSVRRCTAHDNWALVALVLVGTMSILYVARGVAVRRIESADEEAPSISRTVVVVGFVSYLVTHMVALWSYGC